MEQAAPRLRQAATLWPDLASDYHRDHAWTGYRSAQMAAIAKSVFGADADKRLAVVVSSFPGWATPEFDNALADGVRRAGLGGMSDLFKELAVTSYFGGELGVVPGNEVARAVVLGWMAQGDAGIDKAFQELEHGGLLFTNDGKPADGSLDWRIGRNLRHAAQAKAWGLNLVVYEGGVSWSYFMASDKAPYDAFFGKMLADPRMGALMTKMVATFPGTLLNQFADVSGNGQWGPWGMMPNLYTPTPRSKALIDASGR